MKNKIAVVVIHGIGEQIPMATLNGFIETVWTTDDDLIDRNRPDANSGKMPRTQNASWSKPDKRSGSFELRRVTTEQTDTRNRVDFFEFYWAHRITNTTWGQVQSWLFDLMLRNPKTRVPPRLRPVWAAMWVMTLSILLGWLCWLWKSAGAGDLSPWRLLGMTAFSAILTILTAKMVSHIGDVPRYVKAKPENIAARQEIREHGVRLLENLMGFDEKGNWSKPVHDNIIMVGHSLGTIVGYDILSHAFARHNDRLSDNVPESFRQPKRAELEKLVRDELATPSSKFPVEKFQKLQDECRAEMQELGGTWTVSDFVTLGSPLAHAEFLMAEDKQSLEEAKMKRILVTCPPTLEHDRKTNADHFSYHPPVLNKFGNGTEPEHPRFPHHAAIFGYTKWTNIYSPHRLVIWGDLISGPIRPALGLFRGEGKPILCGVKDIPVLPSLTGTEQDKSRRLFTHLKYWDTEMAKPPDGKGEAFHVVLLRKILALGR